MPEGRGWGRGGLFLLLLLLLLLLHVVFFRTILVGVFL